MDWVHETSFYCLSCQLDVFSKSKRHLLNIIDLAFDHIFQVLIRHQFFILRSCLAKVKPPLKKGYIVYSNTLFDIVHESETHDFFRYFLGSHEQIVHVLVFYLYPSKENEFPKVQNNFCFRVQTLNPRDHARLNVFNEAASSFNFLDKNLLCAILYQLFTYSSFYLFKFSRILPS